MITDDLEYSFNKIIFPSGSLNSTISIKTNFTDRSKSLQLKSEKKNYFICQNLMSSQAIISMIHNNSYENCYDLIDHPFAKLIINELAIIHSIKTSKSPRTYLSIISMLTKTSFSTVQLFGFTKVSNDLSLFPSVTWCKLDVFNRLAYWKSFLLTNFFEILIEEFTEKLIMLIELIGNQNSYKEIIFFLNNFEVEIAYWIFIYGISDIPCFDKFIQEKYHEMSFFRTVEAHNYPYVIDRFMKKSPMEISSKNDEELKKEFKKMRILDKINYKSSSLYKFGSYYSTQEINKFDKTVFDSSKKIYSNAFDSGEISSIGIPSASKLIIKSNKSINNLTSNLYSLVLFDDLNKINNESSNDSSTLSDSDSLIRFNNDNIEVDSKKYTKSNENNHNQINLFKNNNCDSKLKLKQIFYTINHDPKNLVLKESSDIDKLNSSKNLLKETICSTTFFQEIGSNKKIFQVINQGATKNLNKHSKNANIINNLKKFNFINVKRENLDKKILRFFRKFTQEKLNIKLTKKKYPPKDFLNDFIKKSLFPPCCTYDNIKFKSFSMSYMEWFFSHEIATVYYEEFITLNSSEVCNYLTKLFKLDDSDKDLLVKYLNSLANIYSNKIDIN